MSTVLPLSTRSLTQPTKPRRSVAVHREGGGCCDGGGGGEWPVDEDVDLLV